MQSLDARRRREGGFALLMSVMLLLFLALLAFAGLATVQRDQEVAGNLNRKLIALDAADAGIAKGLETLNQTGTPSVPTTLIGDSSLYPYGRPSYQADTSNGPPIVSLGAGGVPGFNLQPTQSGAPQFQMDYWKIRVQGNAPGGTTAHVEFATGSIKAN